MIGELALWLARELLKLAAGAALRRAMPTIMLRLDRLLPVILVGRPAASVEDAIAVAVEKELGRPPSAVERLVVRSIWDPVACAANRFGVKP